MADFGRVAVDILESYGLTDPHLRLASGVLETFGQFDPHLRIATGFVETFGQFATPHGRISTLVVEVVWEIPSGGGMIPLCSHVDQSSGALLCHCIKIHAGRGKGVYR